MRHFNVGAVHSLSLALSLSPNLAFISLSCSLCCIFGKYVLKKNSLQKISIFFLIAVLLFVPPLAAKEFVRVKFFNEKTKKNLLFFSLLNVGGLVRN